MSKPVFVYVTYIASTPEKVFKALTDTDATAKFWFGNAVTSDWKVGSPVTFHREGKLIVSGKVLEHDAPRRLSYTFTSHHEPHNGTEKPSRVVMDLEQQRDQSSSPSRTTISRRTAKCSSASAMAGHSFSQVSRAIWKSIASSCTRPGMRKRAPPRRDRCCPSQG